MRIAVAFLTGALVGGGSMYVMTRSPSAPRRRWSGELRIEVARGASAAGC
jgi:hypothetical protein